MVATTYLFLLILQFEGLQPFESLAGDGVPPILDGSPGAGMLLFFLLLPESVGLCLAVDSRQLLTDACPISQGQDHCLPQHRNTQKLHASSTSY